MLEEVHHFRARTRLTSFRIHGVSNFFARILQILHGMTTVAQLTKYVRCVGVRVLVDMGALRLSL